MFDQTTGYHSLAKWTYTINHHGGRVSSRLAPLSAHPPCAWLAVVSGWAPEKSAQGKWLVWKAIPGNTGGETGKETIKGRVDKQVTPCGK